MSRRQCAGTKLNEIKRKRGDAYIAEGVAAMEARNWSEAVVKIQAGLQRSPDNRSGRERLGMFYIMTNKRTRGLKLLAEGISRFYPGRESREQFLKAALAGEDFDTALDAVDVALTHTGGAVDRDRDRDWDWLIDQKARLLLVARRFEAALAWVNAQSSSTELRHESRVVALMEMKRFEEAHEAMDTWREGSGVMGGSHRLLV
ncbi:MAG: hypothetical protein J6386_21880 [Candidatus Synoicihabitans palmerolidicus]|nr:hypothetical protein [Candidatus Synoicihabitans palmerolidicus]